MLTVILSIVHYYNIIIFNKLLIYKKIGVFSRWFNHISYTVICINMIFILFLSLVYN